MGRLDRALCYQEDDMLGKIENMRIYDHAPTAEEIVDIFDQALETLNDGLEGTVGISIRVVDRDTYEARVGEYVKTLKPGDWNCLGIEWSPDKELRII